MRNICPNRLSHSHRHNRGEKHHTIYLASRQLTGNTPWHNTPRKHDAPSVSSRLIPLQLTGHTFSHNTAGKYGTPSVSSLLASRHPANLFATLLHKPDTFHPCRQNVTIKLCASLRAWAPFCAHVHMRVRVCMHVASHWNLMYWKSQTRTLVITDRNQIPILKHPSRCSNAISNK